MLNFFTSHANAERWLADHPQARGRVISIDEAAAAGRALFAEGLNQG